MSSISAAEAKAVGFLNRVLEESELELVAQQLAKQICSKPRLPISSTKQHVNAVSAQIGATMNAWSDADGLLVGLLDAECQAARIEYLSNLGKKKQSRVIKC